MLNLILTILIILNILFITSIILIENNSKKIIFWIFVVSIFSVVGYLPYIVFFSDKFDIKREMLRKAHEDKIYLDLIDYKVSKEVAKSDVINYAKASYNTNFYKNTNVKVFSNIENFNSSLLDDIDKAKDYIIVDNRVFFDSINKDAFTQSLIEKANSGVIVKVIFSKKYFSDRPLIKLLKNSNIRVCKYSKINNLNNYYHNNKNLISIDGKICYIYSTYLQKKRKDNIVYFDLFFKIVGDLVNSIDIEAHKDITYATNKFVELKNVCDSNIEDENEYLYVASSLENNFLDLVLKAIIGAQKSIVLHFNKMILHDSVLEAIKLATKSKVDVRVMVSNVNKQSGYYTTRSYVKELASVGATCYFYDGHINSNYMIIDNKTVVWGNISMVSQNLLCDIQDVIITTDSKMVGLFNNMFNKSVGNSYKLNNSRRKLMREKLFRKFM